MLGKYAEKICTPGYFALHLTTFTANIKYRIDSRAVKCWIMKLLTFQTGLPMWKTRRMWHFVQFKVDRLRAYHTTYIFNIENDGMIF